MGYIFVSIQDECIFVPSQLLGKKERIKINLMTSMFATVAAPQNQVYWFNAMLFSLNL